MRDPNWTIADSVRLFIHCVLESLTFYQVGCIKTVQRRRWAQYANLAGNTTIVVWTMNLHGLLWKSWVAYFLFFKAIQLFLVLTGIYIFFIYNTTLYKSVHMTRRSPAWIWQLCVAIGAIYVALSLASSCICFLGEECNYSATLPRIIGVFLVCSVLGAYHIINVARLRYVVKRTMSSSTTSGRGSRANSTGAGTPGARGRRSNLSSRRNSRRQDSPSAHAAAAREYGNVVSKLRWDLVIGIFAYVLVLIGCTVLIRDASTSNMTYEQVVSDDRGKYTIFWDILSYYVITALMVTYVYAAWTTPALHRSGVGSSPRGTRFRRGATPLASDLDGQHARTRSSPASRKTQLGRLLACLERRQGAENDNGHIHQKQGAAIVELVDVKVSAPLAQRSKAGERMAKGPTGNPIRRASESDEETPAQSTWTASGFCRQGLVDRSGIVGLNQTEQRPRGTENASSSTRSTGTGVPPSARVPADAIRRN